MRIGLNHGTVLYRGGDYVGSAVNVASRVTGAAMAGQVLMTESVASSDHGVDLEQVGVRLLRGVDAPLPLWRVVAQEPARDPVCGSVVVGTPAARLTRDGADVVFCSDECLRAFVATPAS
jgi:class 3 adenylate cyclase